MISTKMGDASQPLVPGPTGVWQRPLRGLTLGIVLVVVAGAFESLAVATIMPAAVRDLAGMELYGWAFSGFTLSNLVGISVGGSEAERLGAVRLLLLGTCVFCAGLLVAALCVVDAHETLDRERDVGPVELVWPLMGERRSARDRDR